MKKWSALLLVALMAGLLLTGCGEKDPEKVAATVVAEVNGQKITKGEATPLLDMILKETVMMAQQYGEVVDPTDKTTLANAKATTLNVFVEGVALEQKLAELGDPLTEDDKARFKTDAEEEYNATIQYYASIYGMSEADATEMLDGYGFSIESVEYSAYRSEVEARLRPFAVEGTTATEEEVREKYDSLVQTATEQYAASAEQYVSDVLNGAAVYAAPEGVRYIKNLVMQFPEEESTQISEKQTEMYNLSYEEYMAQSALQDLTDAAASDEEIAAQQAIVDDFAAQNEALQAEIDALQKQAVEALKPEAEEVLAKAKEADADFDALMTEYNDDTATGDLLTRGYPVAEGVTSYVAEFTDAAMALENIGDISELVESSYGYHILLYAGDVEAGPVAYDDVKSVVEATALSEKEDALLETKIIEWIEAAKIKTYLNRF